jgi:hypothetical protein
VRNFLSVCAGWRRLFDLFITGIYIFFFPFSLICGGTACGVCCSSFLF